MKKITFFLFLFVCMHANSQTFSITGKVTDENNQPLASASVFLTKLNKGTTTDFNGNYQLNVTNGSYDVQVRFIGYKTVSKSVTIANQNATLNFSLKQDNNVLDEVLVSAVRVKATSPVTHSNLDKKEIAKRNLGQDIPVLLNYLPSVVSSSDAGAGIGYTYIRVRGSDASRVNVTINGIPYNDAESQGTFWVNMGDFASSTQSLQLQRGVGTSTNGSAAFGASLNILTDAVSEKSFAEISSSIGSYNTKKHTVKFSTGKINDHIEISGRLSKIYSDGYIDRASTDLKSYFLQASYVDDNTLIKAITFGGKERTYQAWYGIEAAQLTLNRRHNPYTYENEVDDYQQDHYQFHWNETINENWSTNLGVNYTKGQGFFEQFKENSKVSKYNNLVVATGVTWDGKPATDLIVRRWLDNKFYVANFNATYKKNNLEIISGASYSEYSNKHFGEIIWAKEFAASASIRDHYYDSFSRKNDFSMFSKATFNLTDNFIVFTDLQYRNVTYKTNGLTSDRDPINIDSKFNFFNPKIGFTYTINNSSSLYASYARANREPNRKDFESNANVKPEKMNDFEMGWRFKNKAVKLNSNIYYMQYKDQLVLTGHLDDTGEYKRENVDNSYRLGLELDADIRLNKQFSIRPNIAISTNKIKDFILTRDGTSKNLGNTNISFSPNVIAGNAIVYHPNTHFQLALLSKYVGEQYLSNTDTDASKLESYFTSDINVSYELNPKSIFTSIVFTGLINNVFNKEYVDRGYTYLDYWSGPSAFEVQGYYPQATRNFLVGVTLRF